MTATDYAAVYRSTRHRITSLVGGLPAETLDHPAPATPAWSLRDIVAHLSGTTADIVSGNLTGAASDPWTEAQVAARRDRSLSEILEEWERCSAIVEPRLSSADPMMRRMLLTDAVTHEHDLRGAVGDQNGRDSDALGYGFLGVSLGIGAQRGEAGALRILHEAGETVVGSGGTTATLRASRFEVLRAAVGRRSPDQIIAWDWDGAGYPETVVLGMFAPPRPTPLVE